MSANSVVQNTPPPVTRELAFSLLSAARSAYMASASSNSTKMEALTLAQSEGGSGAISRFNTAYENAQYTTDYFVDEGAWAFAQRATRDLAALAGEAGEEGVKTAVGAVKQIPSDVKKEAEKLADDVDDWIPILVLGLFSIAVIVVLK